MANSNGWGDGAANNSIGWSQGANNAIAWGDSHAKSWAGATDIVGLTTDPAASAYFASTGITGATQQTAIDNLVKGLKQDGLWSKMKAVYPFVTDNRNLFGYTENFGNAYWDKSGATFISNSITSPTGTNNASRFSGYFFTPINLISGNTYTISAYAKSASGLGQAFLLFGNDFNSIGQVAINGSWQRVSYTFTATTASGNLVGFAGGSTGYEIDVWGAQIELGSTATTYQTIATTQQAFISNQFKYNLVNPVDSDAAFRLVFNGGWTHSANGATPNGTNGYADTKLVPSSVLLQNSVSTSIYSRTNNTLLTQRIELGSGNGTVDFQECIRWDGTLGNLSRLNNGYIIGTSGYLPTKTSGYFVTSRTGATTTKKFEDNILKETTADPSQIPNSIVLFIGARNTSGTATFYDVKQYAFAHIADGLTDTEAANLYTRVQAFQTALSRQV